jgi:hypothetical protein
MFHVKHWLRRRPRPRLLGERRPFYSRGAVNHFAKLGGAASRVVWQLGDRAEALDDLSVAFEACKLYANDTLLESVRHYCLVVQAYSRGDTDETQVREAETEYYAACREALGIPDH